MWFGYWCVYPTLIESASCLINNKSCRKHFTTCISKYSSAAYQIWPNIRTVNIQIVVRSTNASLLNSISTLICFPEITSDWCFVRYRIHWFPIDNGICVGSFNQKMMPIYIIAKTGKMTKFAVLSSDIFQSQSRRGSMHSTVSIIFP